MDIKNNYSKYTIFRKKYNNFIFEKFNLSFNETFIEVDFEFVIEDLVVFNPKTKFFVNKSFNDFERKNLEVLCFYLGMIEAVSYWKSCCCQNFIIKPFSLDDKQHEFFKKLFFNGLGEFFYLNMIDPNYEDFINFIQASDRKIEKIDFFSNSNSFILPIGGGKDSIVSLEFLKHLNSEILPMMLNPREAMTDTVRVADIDKSKCLISYRNIDANLLNLNEQGFLNGHTPFSSLLAFQSLVFAYVNNVSNIALSNESSANEPTVPGTKINHQYSKSIEFESDFRDFVKEFISEGFNYFSLLRPLSELQIASILSKNPQYFKVFKSCNVGSKSNSWCGMCPKCLFTAIMLLPFLSINDINKVFEKEIFNEIKLLEILEQLIGIKSFKPFECVGTVSEVKLALSLGVFKNEKNGLPILLEYFKNSDLCVSNSIDVLQHELSEFDDNNFLTKKMYEQLQEFIRINN